MSWESCIILLNSDSTGSFYCGDIVTGSVVLEFKKEQKIENIIFKVRGLSKAQWTRSMPTIPYVKIHSEKRVVLDYAIDVFSDINGRKIKAGIKTFHFHFLIPEDAPSTFKSSIAEVSYHIVISGKSKCMLRNHKITAVTVKGNVNLNNIEEYSVPTFVETRKSFWGSGSFSICLKTYKGFSPKQYAPFEAIITNEDKVRITKINVILVQKLKYTVSTGYANEEKKIFKVQHRKFSNTLPERCHFGMEIPQTLPSSVYLVNPMIDVSYVFRLEVIFPFHTTLFKDIPITISTIPVIHNDFEEIQYKIT